MPAAAPTTDDADAGRKLRRAAPWTVLTRVLTLVATLAVTSLAFRTLPADAFGLLSVVRASVLLLALLASGGLDRTLWRFAPELRGAHGEAGAAALLRRVWRWQALALLVVLALLAALWRPMLGWLGADEQSVEAADASLGWALAGLTAATLAYQTLVQALVSGYRTLRVTLATGARAAAWIAAGVGLVAVAATAPSHWIAAEALALGLGAALMLSRSPRGQGAAQALSRALPARRHLSLAGVFLLSGVVNFVVQRQSEVFFIARYHGLELAGIYDLVYAYPQLAIEFVPLATSAVVSSALAEVYTRDPAQLRANTARYFRLLATFSLPVAALGAVWADALLVLLFGAKVASEAYWAQVFSVVHVLPLVFLPLSAALITREKAHWVLPLGPAQAALNLGLDLWLIPRYGIAGAAMAVGGTLAFGIPATFWLARRVMGPVGFPAGHVARVAALSLAALAGWPVGAWLGPGPWALLGLPVSTLAVAAALWFGGGLGPPERAALARLGQRLTGRRGP